jgi:hypothetical protein
MSNNKMNSIFLSFTKRKKVPRVTQSTLCYCNRISEIRGIGAYLLEVLEAEKSKIQGLPASVRTLLPFGHAAPKISKEGQREGDSRGKRVLNPPLYMNPLLQ